MDMIEKLRRERATTDEGVRKNQRIDSAMARMTTTTMIKRPIRPVGLAGHAGLVRSVPVANLFSLILVVNRSPAK